MLYKRAAVIIISILNIFWNRSFSIYSSASTNPFVIYTAVVAVVIGSGSFGDGGGSGGSGGGGGGGSGAAVGVVYKQHHQTVRFQRAFRHLICIHTDGVLTIYFFHNLSIHNNNIPTTAVHTELNSTSLIKMSAIYTTYISI